MIKRTLLILVSTLSLTGCFTNQPTTPIVSTTGSGSSAMPVDSVTLSERDSGSTVSVKMGQTLAISLPANPSTGYSWNLTTSPSTTTISKVSNTYQAAPTAVVGSGGLELWQFLALKTGTTSLTLKYAHSWEISTTTEKEFTLTVIVQ